MDFAGVAIEGSTRLSANDTLLYDENVNPFAPQSVLPTDSIAPFDQSDSNDNTVVYNEGPSGDGDILASNSRHLAHSQAKQLKANRRSFTVRKDPLPEASNPEQSSGDRVPVPCPVPVEARRELKPNRRSFTVAKAPSVQGKPLSGTCGDRTTNTEASCANENLSRDSEAGPEVAEFSEEEFRCASEHFKDPSAFDFLQKFGGSKQLGRSSLGRCSLFLKFDPLLADRRQSIAPAKVIKEKESPVAVPPPDVPSAESKPEALIDWATSPKNLLDQTFPVRSDQVQTQEQMFSEKEMSQALKFQELMFQERLLKKDQDKSEQEKQMHRHFEAQDNTIRNMFQAIKELAKTCDNNVKEQQRITADLTEVTKERDQLVEDLRGVEAAFSDFHRRYEQAKDIIRTMKENETLLKSQMAETQDMLEKRNQMLSTLKTKAEESIETANKEIESSRKTMDAENTVLKAQLKKAEMKINSLEKHLEQKTEEISQLTQMYDDLLSKVQQN